MSNVYARCLAVEVAVVLIVTAVFRVVEPRFVAGMIAGCFFVGLGVFILAQGLRKAEVRRSLTFGLGCVHLFAMALPMIITRIVYAGDAFQSVRILGMSGPVFHAVSSVVYLLLMLATAFDWWRSKRAEVLKG